MHHFNTVMKQKGFLAQLVEQRIENPCVPGSIPGETTNRFFREAVFVFIDLRKLLFFKFLHYYLWLSTKIWGLGKKWLSTKIWGLGKKFG